MKVTLNTRGRLFLIFAILMTLISIPIRIPVLVLVSILMVAYVISYSLRMRRVEIPEIDISAKMRHRVLYRGEIDILQITIQNYNKDVIPLIMLDINLPVSIFAVDKPLNYFFTLEPMETKVFNIPLIAATRGNYRIGPIRAVITDPFKIFEDELGKIEEISVKVYPKRLASKVAKSRAKKVFSKIIGFFSIAIKGTGTDFHGLREYIRGDPSKIVDWNATARANKLISKEFEDEKKLDVIIAVDAGSTMRGTKFDYMLGMAMDLYSGFINTNKPVGLLIFNNNIVKEYLPSTSNRRMAIIWSSIYDLQPKDVYSDYNLIDKWIDKNGITNGLIITLGDLEGDFREIDDTMRNIKLRGNQVIFIDVWGYSFSYEERVKDSAIQMGGDMYGIVLKEFIGEGIKQYNIFRAMEIKSNFARYGAIYGYIEDYSDNVINALDRAMYSFFGRKWKAV